MAREKTEALLVMDRRSFQYPRIVLGEHEVECKTSIKYLGVQLDRGLSFGEHLKSQLPKPSNVEKTWLGLCQTLVEPGKRKGDW